MHAVIKVREQKCLAGNKRREKKRERGGENLDK